MATHSSILFFLNRSENVFFKMYLFIYLAAQVLVMACGI